jgi:hypothetical protein
LKIDVSIDCTPEEARRFMGLPDMAPIHDLYLDKLRETMSEGVSPEFMERLTQSWAPMGEAGFNAWRQLVDQMTGMGGGAKRE